MDKGDRLVPPLRSTRNMHQLSFQIPSSRSNYRKFSYFPRTIRDWNALPPDIVSAKTFDAFIQGSSIRTSTLTVYTTLSAFKKFLHYMRTPHVRTINLLMVAIKRQKQYLRYLKRRNFHKNNVDVICETGTSFTI